MKQAFALLAVLFLFSVVVGNAKADTQYTVTDLGTLPGGYESTATGINNNGQVVGYGNGASGDAFLYSGGSMTDLGTLGSQGSFACGVNDLGQVVGSSVTSVGNQLAFIYSDGVMTPLGTLPGNSYPDACAYAINDRGQAVGCAR